MAVRDGNCSSVRVNFQEHLVIILDSRILKVGKLTLYYGSVN